MRSQGATSYDLPGTLWTLIRTDFKTRYHGTWMGFLWALMKPATMCLVLLAVFSFLFASTQSYAENLLIGILLYEFFSEATRAGIVSLHTRGYLVSKSRLPRWMLVLTSMSSALLTLVVASTALLVFLSLSGRFPGVLETLTFILYLVLFAAMAAGFSLASSVLFIRYRDLNQFWDLAVQAGFFVAPVIYPIGILPERYHLWLYLWPPTSVIQFSRMVLTGQSMPTLRGHLLLLALTIGIVGLGMAIYGRMACKTAEYL